MEPEGRASDDERAARVASVEAIRARGDDPYPVRFDRYAHPRRGARALGRPGSEPASPTDDGVAVAGRMRHPAGAGQARLRHLPRRHRDPPAVRQQGRAGRRRVRPLRDEVDRGDWVGAEGTVMKTKKGELSVNVKTFKLLSKSLRPLAGEVARTRRRRHPLPPAVRRPHRQRRDAARVRRALRRARRDPSLPRGARFRRGRDAGAHRAPRFRCGAPVHDAPQRARRRASRSASRPSCI